MEFLYSKGAIYVCCNNNLLFHGCIPLDKDGNFQIVELDGKLYKGKKLLDYADALQERHILASIIKIIWILRGIFGVEKNHLYVVET